MNREQLSDEDSYGYVSEESYDDDDDDDDDDDVAMNESLSSDYDEEEEDVFSSDNDESSGGERAFARAFHTSRTSSFSPRGKTTTTTTSQTQQQQQQQSSPKRGAAQSSPAHRSLTRVSSSQQQQQQPLRQQQRQRQRPQRLTQRDAGTTTSGGSGSVNNSPSQQQQAAAAAAATIPRSPPPPNDDLSAGILPDVLISMRQQIESLTLFDSDILKRTSPDAAIRESLKRSSEKSISPAVLVSLAHKTYERRRLAAMEIEKIVKSLVQKHSAAELERIRAILLLLSDDYVRSTNEDARKGGVVALSACAMGLKLADDADCADNEIIAECRDLILASVVHARVSGPVQAGPVLRYRESL